MKTILLVVAVGVWFGLETTLKIWQNSIARINININMDIIYNIYKYKWIYININMAEFDCRINACPFKIYIKFCLFLKGLFTKQIKI